MELWINNKHYLADSETYGVGDMNLDPVEADSIYVFLIW